MGTPLYLLLIICITGTLSAPLQVKNSDLCAKKCLYPTGNLAYNASYTYEYAYVGTSKVQFGDRGKGTGQMDVQATIELGWADPCNAIIQIKDAKVLGETEITSALLTTHPLMVGVQNGVVTDVCADPDDEPAGLNFKKGIMSQIQNSLPFISPVFTDMSFEERDIVGACLVDYKVKADKSDRSHFVITKYKDHKLCSTKYQNSMTKLPLPLWISQILTSDSISYSTCTQVVRNQIIKSVQCEDINNFVSVVEKKKRSLQATQTSKLTFQRKTKGIPGYSGPKRVTTLEFETRDESKQSEFTKHAVHMLKNICKNMEGSIKRPAPQQISKMISFLYRTPDIDLGVILGDITSGKICSNSEEMEAIYTDALLIIRTSGAMRLMLDKIRKGQLTGLRQYLYAAHLHLISKPSLDMVKVVRDAIDDPKLPTPIVLALGSIVKKYCQQDSQCLQEQSVKQIYESLSRNIISSCSNSKEKHSAKMAALVALKVAGNAGNLVEPIQKVVLACLSSQDADLPVRLAAAEAFRQSQLAPQTVDFLSNLAQDDTMPSEIRIACYLAVYNKASFWQLQQILDTVKRQSTSQVRSFVLSHMRNLQLTNNPDLQDLRYSMLSLTIPQDFRKDMQGYSSSVERSQFWRSMSTGAALQTNWVFSPASVFPRQLNLNLTTNAFGGVNNLLETGLRMQDIEALSSAVFSSNGFLSHNVMVPAIQKAVTLVQERGLQLLHRDKLEKQLEEIYDQVLTHISHSQGKDAKTKLDGFIRLFGEEFGFFSFSGYPRNLESSQMIKDIMENSMQGLAQALIKAMDKDYAFTYMTQVKNEHFVPTVQGIPLQFKAVATFIARIYASSRLEDGIYKANGGPQGYAQITSFIGYSLGAKSGLRANYTIGSRSRTEVIVTQTKSSFSVKLNLPPKQEVLLYEKDIYLFNKRPGGADEITGCPKQAKLQHSVSCNSAVEKKLGLRLCESRQMMSAPPAGCSLWQSRRSFLIEKPKSDSPIVHLKGSMRSSKGKEHIELDLQAPQAKSPSIGVLNLDHEKHNNNDVVMMKMKTPQGTKSLKASATWIYSDNGNEYDLVVFSSNKDTINPQTDKVIKIVSGKGATGDTRKVYLIASTENCLRKYVLANINVQSSYKVAREEDGNYIMVQDIQLERFEVDLGTLGYRTKNYIRRAQNTNKISIFSDSQGPKERILKVESSVLWKGSLRNRDVKSHAVTTIETAKNNYDLESELNLKDPKKHFLLKIEKPNKQRIAFIQATIKDDQRYNIETALEVDIPSKMKPYQLEGSLKEISPQNRMIKLTLKKAKKLLYSVSGPVKCSKNEGVFVNKLNLTATAIPKQKYVRLESNIYSSEEKKTLEVGVFRTGNLLVGKVSAKQNTKPAITSRSVAMVVPNLVDTLVKYKSSPDLADMSADVKLSLKNKEQRRIKAQSQVSFAENKISAQLIPNADKQPQKMIEYSSTYSIHESDMQLLSRGSLIVYGDQYKYAAKVMAGSYSENRNEPNEIDLKFINPKNQEMKMALKYDNVQKIEGGETSRNYDLAATMSTYAKSQYKAAAAMRRTEQDDASFYRTIYNVTLSSPAYEVKLGRRYDGPSNPKSMQYRETALYSEDTLLVKEGEKTLYDVKLERKGKDVDINLGAKIKGYNIQLHSSQQKALFLSVNENGVKVIEADCEIPNAKDWKVSISSQSSKRVRSHSSQTPSVIPSDSKMISKGVLVFDIFKNVDPLTVDVVVLKEAKPYYLLEAVLKMPNQVKTPRLVAHLGMTPKAQILEVSLSGNIKSPVVAKLTARHSHISPKYCNVQAKLEIPEETLQFAALVQKHSSLSCMGMSVNGSLASKRNGKVQIMGSSCGPAYIELGVKRQKSAAASLLKIGIKSYSSIKLALDKVYEVTDKDSCGCSSCKCLSTWSLYERKLASKENIAMVGAKLKHPQLIQFLVKFNSEQQQQFKMEVWEPSVKSVKDVYNAICKDIEKAAKIIPKAVEIQPKLKEFVSVIAQKIKSLPESFRWWSKVIKYIKEMRERLQRAFERIIKWKDEFVQKIKEIIWRIFHYDLEKLSNVTLDNIIDRLKNKLHKLETKLLDALIRLEEKAVLPNIWKEIKKYLIEYRETIIKDLDYVNDHFVPKIFRPISDVVVERIEDWLMNLRNRYLGPLLAPLINKNSGMWLTKQGGGWLALTLPIQTPVTSVAAAVSKIGLPRRQVALMLHQNTFSLFTKSRKIASLTPNNIVTFDGLGIPVIPSRCKILMIKAGKVAIEAEIISKQHMELVVLAPYFITKVVILQDKSVKVVPLVKGGLQSDVKIEKSGPHKVVLRAPSLTVTITDKSVLFESKVAKPEGILGCHDNEVANDVPPHMKILYQPDSPISTHQISKKGALEIFNKYRLKKSCQIQI